MPVGAHNSVVGADQGFRAPSGDRGSVRDSVHEDSASARISAGQRPRPSFRHPQGKSLRWLTSLKRLKGDLPHEELLATLDRWWESETSG